jgi:hypothetical protein
MMTWWVDEAKRMGAAEQEKTHGVGRYRLDTQAAISVQR